MVRVGGRSPYVANCSGAARQRVVNERAIVIKVNFMMTILFDELKKYVRMKLMWVLLQLKRVTAGNGRL